MKSVVFLCLIFFTLLLTNCRKTDNPRIPDLLEIPIPLLILDKNSDSRISGLEPEAFHAAFSIDIYFKNGEYPKQLDLVVVKNGDAANALTVLPNITTWPVIFEITGQQLIDLFKEPIRMGDFFEFSTDVTTLDGHKISAFPMGGAIPFSPAVYNLPGSSPVLKFEAPCPFHIEDYKGIFVIQRDDWGEYSRDEIIDITVEDDTHLSFKYKADNATPIIMKIDTSTNAVTVDIQKYGSYSGEDFFVESIAGENSLVDPCTPSISVNLYHTTAAGTFDGIIIMRKR